MKKSMKRRYCPAYPNAADRFYYEQKAVTVLSAIASAAGFVVVMLCLVVLV